MKVDNKTPNKIIRISEIHENLEAAEKQRQADAEKARRNIPVSAGNDSDDLSKVASSDIIGKGGESDLNK